MTNVACAKLLAFVRKHTDEVGEDSLPKFS
jgi:hypothetical protein